MVTAAGRTAVSRVLAGRFLRLAAEAEAGGEHRVARARFLSAIQHDATAGARLEFARFLSDAGQSASAIAVLEEAWQRARRINSFSEMARCCRQLALLFRGRCCHAQARQFAQQAAAAEMSGWDAHQAAFSAEQLTLESILAADAGEPGRAFQLARAALEVSDSSQRATVLRHLAALSMTSGMRQEAVRLLVMAARGARNEGDLRGSGECLLDLAHVLQSLRRGRLAVECFRTAAQRLRRSGQIKRATLALRRAEEAAAIERTRDANPLWN